MFYKLVEMFKRQLSEGSLTLSDVMLQAVAAKNAIIRRCGFSAQFLALGNNSFFDAIDEADPPMLRHLPGDPASNAQERLSLRRAAQQTAIQIQSCPELRDIFNSILVSRAPMAP